MGNLNIEVGPKNSKGTTNGATPADKQLIDRIDYLGGIALSCRSRLGWIMVLLFLIFLTTSRGLWPKF